MSKSSKEFWTGERCFIAELLNADDVPEVSLARARVPPGVTTELHSLTVAEWYIVESGSGIMTVGDTEPRPVRACDVVAVPKDVAQKIYNNGDDDLLFLCVCAPRFLQESYTSLE